MKRENKNCKLFKNGNLNIKIQKNEMDEFNSDRILFLDDLLFWMDCNFIGETYCLSNYETGHTIYNNYMDCCYVFSWNNLDDLGNGKTIKLYAHPVEDWEREIIDTEENI